MLHQSQRYDESTYDRRDTGLKGSAVARIQFEHAKQNAFPANNPKALQLAFEKVSSDDDVHVIVLQSDPSKAFCAGASIDDH